MLLSRFWTTLGAIFLTPRKPKTAVFMILFARGRLPLVAENTVATAFVGQHPAKTGVFTHVARHSCSTPKSQKRCKLRWFGLWHAPKKNQKSGVEAEVELLSSCWCLLWYPLVMEVLTVEAFAVLGSGSFLAQKE